MNNSKRFKPDFSIYAEEWKHLYEDEKLSTLQIADRFGCCKQTVTKLLRDQGVQIRLSGRTASLDYLIEEWKSLYKEGVSCAEISRRYNCSRKTVEHKIKELGCKRPFRGNDLTNQVFGRWTVRGRGKTKKRGRKTFWDCICTCGVERDVEAYGLTSGASISCGCYMREVTGVLAKNHLTKHGMSHTLVHSSWRSMIDRCTNKESPAYPEYAGRGILVCERWLDFENFYADMGDRPSTQHSIERKNNDLGYEPGNCKWATRKEQQRNTRWNRLLSFNGETLCVSEWAERMGERPSLITWRINNGWTTERALTEPSNNPKNK